MFSMQDADALHRRIHAQAPSAPNLFRREGDFWHVRWRGRASFVPHARAMPWLAYLLGNPHVPAHVLALSRLDADAPEPLVGGDGPLRFDVGADCGEVIDARARGDYRRRMRELCDELAQADRSGDRDAGERARQELAFLDRELRRASGFGGRSRRTGSQVERARVNVTRGLRDSVGRIAAVDLHLGSHLDRSLRTGLCCCYEPEPESVSWSL